MAFPDVLTVIDNFNRADGAVNAGAGAAIWDTIPLNTGSPIVNITTNRVDHGIGGAQCVSLASYGPDVDFYWTMAGNAEFDASHYLACFFAFASPNTSTFSGYAIIGGLTATANEWSLFKYTAGAGSNIGSFGVQAVALADSVGVSMRGSTITAKYKAAAGSWGTLGTPIVDTTYNRAGVVAFEFGVNGIDDFSGGTFTAGTTYTKTGLAVVGP